jgi:hypothetical protein
VIEYCELPSTVPKLASRGKKGISWGTFVSFLNSVPVFSFVEQKADRLFSFYKDFLHKKKHRDGCTKPTLNEFVED